MIFLSCFSILKIKVTYFCLKLYRSPSYTISTIYFASQPNIRSQAASTTNTDVKRPHRYTCSSAQNSQIYSAHTDMSPSTCQIVKYSTALYFWWGLLWYIFHTNKIILIQNNKFRYIVIYAKCVHTYIHTQKTYILTWSIFIEKPHDSCQHIIKY